jgi:hypothetical protein
MPTLERKLMIFPDVDGLGLEGEDRVTVDLDCIVCGTPVTHNYCRADFPPPRVCMQHYIVERLMGFMEALDGDD